MITFTDAKTGKIVSIRNSAVCLVEQYDGDAGDFCNEYKKWEEKTPERDRDMANSPCDGCMGANLLHSMVKVKANGRWRYIAECEKFGSSSDELSQTENVCMIAGAVDSNIALNLAKTGK